MSLKKNQDTAQRVLTAVGGEKNVSSVSHCATRLRFVLKDEEKADTASLERDPAVIKIIRSGGQYQVVTGTDAADVYEELLTHSSLSVKKPAEEKTNPFNQLLGIITAIFTPFIGALAAAGILKGALTLAVTLGWTTQESGIYTVLFAVADGIFTFLPILLAVTAAKKFGTNEYLALALTLGLVHPSILAAAQTAAEENTALKFLNIPVILGPNGYLSSVIPIILAIFVQSYVERFFKKAIPSFLSLIGVPLCVLLIMAPITFIVIGPLGTIIGDFLTRGYTAAYEFSPWLAGAIMGGLWQVFVIFGAHWSFVPITHINIQQQGWDSLIPLLLSSVLAQGGAALAVFLRTKNTALKELAGTSAVTPALGITEPTVYGVTLPLKRPFIAGCIGGAIGGAIVGFFQVKASAFTLISLLSLPTFILPGTNDPSGMIAAIAGASVAFVIGFGLTLALGFKDAQTTDAPTEDTGENKNPGTRQPVEEHILSSPLQGRIVSLSDVEDELFSSRTMGDGVAIEPTGNKLYAPCDGTLTMLFPTGHAVGLTTAEGVEILIHIGTDTVSLNGKGFKTHAAQGTSVRKGDLLITFEKNTIADAGLSDITTILIPNSKKYAGMSITQASEVAVGDRLLAVTEKTAAKTTEKTPGEGPPLQAPETRNDKTTDQDKENQ